MLPSLRLYQQCRPEPDKLHVHLDPCLPKMLDAVLQIDPGMFRTYLKIV
jgi:hypothetical protein